MNRISSGSREKASPMDLDRGNVRAALGSKGVGDATAVMGNALIHSFENTVVRLRVVALGYMPLSHQFWASLGVELEADGRTVAVNLVVVGGRASKELGITGKSFHGISVRLVAHENMVLRDQTDNRIVDGGLGESYLHRALFIAERSRYCYVAVQCLSKDLVTEADSHDGDIS